MTFKIEKLTAVTITSKEEYTMPTIQHRHLPAKLDRAACIAFLTLVDPQLTPTAIQAAGGFVDLNDVDSVIEYAELRTEEAFRFKSALAEVGLISRGRKYNR